MADQEKPTVVAARIARVHNDLRAVVLESGVLVFSPGAHSVEPFREQPPGLDIDRLPFPVVQRNVSPAAVQRWLTKHRAYQAEAYEVRDRLREEARGRHAIRLGVAAMNEGMRKGAWNCRSCGGFASAPADECPQCGNTELTYNGDPHETNRAFGYAA